MSNCPGDWITSPDQLDKRFRPGWYGMERTDDWKPVSETRHIVHHQRPELLRTLLEDGLIRVFGPIIWPEG